MIKAILTLLTTLNLVDTTDSICAILSTVGNAFFYLMPIILAYTMAKRLNSNPFLVMVMVTILFHPDLGALLSQGNTSYFRLPATSAPYSSSILPMLLMVPLMRWIERSAGKVCPDMVRMLLKPLIVIFASVPVVLVVIGPTGAIVGNYLANGANFLYNKTDWLIIAVLSAIMPFIVMTGMHCALISICIISLTSFGHGAVLITTMFCSNLTQDGASMAVAVKAKDSAVKSIAPTAGISTIVAGITEPAMYGITLRYKTPMIAVVCGAGASGLYSGITHLAGYTVGGSPSALTLIQMIDGERLVNFPNGVVALVISLGVSFPVSLTLCKPDPTEAGEKEAASAEEIKIPPQEIEPLVEHIEVKSPLNGAVIFLKEVSDPVLLGGVLGEGAAVISSNGKVYAPVDGMISAVMDSKHATRITADSQAEILIHVDLDTVSLKGEGFDPHRKMGNGVKAGDLLLESDLSLLKEKGYDVITPALVSNLADLINIKAAETEETVAGEVLLTTVQKKRKYDYEKKMAIASNNGSCAGIRL